MQAQTATIFIDPGHGGATANGKSTPVGVVGPAGTQEHAVAFALAQRTTALLGDSARLTRTSATDNPSLSQRIHAARAGGAHVFVSLHANRSGAEERGPETWVHPEAGEGSRALAQAIQGNLGSLRGSLDRVLDGELAVLHPARHATGTHACLVEVENLAHPDGEARLNNPSELDAMAQAVASAIRNHLESPQAGAGGTYGRVDPGKVSCADKPRDWPIFTAMQTEDPVGELQAADARALQLLDNTIGELQAAQARIQGGEPAAYPVIGDVTAQSLSMRMRLDPSDAQVWRDSSAPGTVGLVVRWLSSIRRILNGGHISYSCIGNDCAAGDWAYTWINPAGPNDYRIHLCRKFWQLGNLDNRALTLIHEASHIYYNTEDSGRGPGAAECLTQFVSDTNDIQVHAEFRSRCGGQLPSAPGT